MSMHNRSKGLLRSEKTHKDSTNIFVNRSSFPASPPAPSRRGISRHEKLQQNKRKSSHSLHKELNNWELDNESESGDISEDEKGNHIRDGPFPAGNELSGSARSDVYSEAFEDVPTVRLRFYKRHHSKQSSSRQRLSRPRPDYSSLTRRVRQSEEEELNTPLLVKEVSSQLSANPFLAGLDSRSRSARTSSRQRLSHKNHHPIKPAPPKRKLRSSSSRF